ncbi:MAG: efflux RND transporter permease subunit [Proteobacteria bacterium]|nr:efflux RND transporter permease subunit [Pseudomonadota bacterium]
MNLPKFALEHRSIVLAFIAIILAVGMFNFKTMSRREDPEIIMRDALVVTSWPGASSIRVDELITDPLEDVLVEIPEIVTVRSKSMAGLSVIQVTADDAVTNPDQIWDDVRAKVRVANAELPAGAGPAIVNSDFGDVYEIVFALHQRPNERGLHYSPRELEVIAERIEEELEVIDEVARVEFWGNQPERIYVEIDSADWAQLEITAGQLQGLFQSRNIVFPGGEIDTQDARFMVNPTGEFTSIAQIDDLIVGRNEGVPVTLKDLPFSVERRYEEPPRSAARVTTPEFAHRPAIVLGISMKSGRNIADLDRSVEDVITRLKNSVIPPDIELPRVNDLPRQVSTRIVDFQFNLLQGVLIVLAVALLTMGWRPALIMAAAIPLSIISTFAVVRSLGIELEQFSIASLIIALGMVVDNAIVVSDNALRLIREGVPKREAVVDGAHGLAIPILTSTLTTIVAFLPMLTISGNVGEYVASLPVVVATTLASSYVVAMLVTPILCLWLLDKETGSDTSTGFIGRLNERYEHGIQWCLARPGKVVGYAGVAFLASLLLIPVVGSQFFPAGSRDQFFIKVWLPEGSPIGATLSVSRQVEQMLVEESAVPGAETGQRLRNALTVIGTGGPRLMLTQEPEYDYPYYALILVNTTSPLHTEAFAAAMRDRVSRIADARITVDKFMLGPPIKDPVAFRISGPERNEIARIAREAIKIFKRTPGTVYPYSNWGAPANRLDIEVDSFAANLAGVSNAEIAFTTSAFLSGVPLTNYREGDNVVRIMLRVRQAKPGGEGSHVKG